MDYQTGLLEWTTGMDYWTGLLDWTTGLDYWNGLLEWTAGLSLSQITNVSVHAGHKLLAKTTQ